MKLLRVGSRSYGDGDEGGGMAEASDELDPLEFSPSSDGIVKPSTKTEVYNAHPPLPPYLLLYVFFLFPSHSSAKFVTYFSHNGSVSIYVYTIYNMCCGAIPIYDAGAHHV
jgi:hypothetical protein